MPIYLCLNLAINNVKQKCTVCVMLQAKLYKLIFNCKMKWWMQPMYEIKHPATNPNVWAQEIKSMKKYNPFNIIYEKV